MKFVIIFAALVVVCVTAPTESDVTATIVQDDRKRENENYQFDFKTSNGISRTETGTFTNVTEDDNSGIAVSGFVNWTAPNGHPEGIKYTANKYGYHPVLPYENIEQPTPIVVRS